MDFTSRAAPRNEPERLRPGSHDSPGAARGPCRPRADAGLDPRGATRLLERAVGGDNAYRGPATLGFDQAGPGVRFRSEGPVRRLRGGSSHGTECWHKPYY